ncbi:MAG: 30S ribosome-binding factor RbfA [Christensenellales bacterium]|jgi:ribosome-binding factor A
MSKIDRINSELNKQIALIINNELKHPAVNGIITVTVVDTSSDLSLSKVGVSVLDDNHDEVVKALNHSSGFIRKLLRNKVNIRNIPELTFYKDNNIEYAYKISRLIDKINKE